MLDFIDLNSKVKGVARYFRPYSACQSTVNKLQKNIKNDSFSANALSMVLLSIMGLGNL